MSDGITSTSPATSDTIGFWSQFRRTFGPVLVGLLGGGLTAGVACSAMLPLLKNVSDTYSQYPSLQPPWLARDVSPPGVVLIPLAVLGAVAPFGMGLATAWLVRSKDRWGEVSAGLTTALTGTLAAYAVGIGWAVVLATVVVPSIWDLTLFGDSTKAPAEAAGKPSDVLAERYPDLKEQPADERGGKFFAKIVADQVVGSAYGVWLGVGLSLATVGLLGFCGTLAGGWLLRRGGSCRSIAVPYFELTVSTSVAVGQLILAAAGLGNSMTWFRAVCLVAITTLVVVGVVDRWHWLLRVAIAATWGLVLWGAGLGDSASGLPAPVAYLTYGVLGFLLVRHWFFSARRPAVTTA
ncbi:MAG: hypothetical protein JWO38_5211 [Gemmataceae bacterium]|nr:hypothetical protein [Gemmataceae bacterium]